MFLTYSYDSYVDETVEGDKIAYTHAISRWWIAILIHQIDSLYWDDEDTEIDILNPPKSLKMGHLISYMGRELTRIGISDARNLLNGL